MLILLPPSAGKTSPSSGPSLNLAGLTAPELTSLRERVIDDVQQVSARPDALSILEVGPSLESEIRAQIDFYDQPCAPAWQVYTGVLYSAADFAGLNDAQMSRADAVVRIFSGVFGFSAPTDLIPAYRLAMNTTLPQVGKVQGFWKKALREAELAELSAIELVIDARSTEYQVWNPASSAQYVTIAAARIKNGRRSVVSHSAKFYRGLLTGALLREPNAPRSGNELADFARTLTGTGHITGIEFSPAEGRRPAKLTLVEDLG